MTDAVPIKVDRHLTTPFLLKVFYRVNCFHRLEDFRPTSQPPASVEVYTWKDCTLTELSTLLLSALPSISATATKCSFKLIYADTRTNRYTSNNIGDVLLPIKDGEGGKSLDDISFVVGDWIDVAVTCNTSGHGGENGIGIRGRGRGGGVGVIVQARLPVGNWNRGDTVDQDSNGPPMRNGGGGGGGGARRGGGFGGGGGRRGDRW